MIKLLLICNIVIVLFFIFKYCINRTKVDINHIFCFSFGYVYYCIIPLVCFEWEFNFQGIPYNDMLSYYRTISTSRIAYYIISMFLIYLCFIIGSVYGKVRFRIVSTRIRVFHTDNVSFNYSQKLVYPFVVLLAFGIMYLNRASLFQGYNYFATSDSYDSMRVLLSVYEFVIIVCTLYYLNSNPQLSLFKKICNKWTLLFVFYSLLLFTTGGRLYVITSLLAIVVFLSYSKGMTFRIGTLLCFGALFALTMGLIGISRFGFVGFDFKLAVFNIFEEPLYTNYSNITYLKSYSPLNIICAPVTLLSAIVNLLPTMLFPWKLEFIKYITDIYPDIQQPLGATHFYPSYNAGLGLMPSMFLFYYIGKLLGRIHKSYDDASITKRVAYCLVCSNLAFSLFRDPIATSLVKNIVEFSIILPWVISGLNDSLYMVRKRKES